MIVFIDEREVVRSVFESWFAREGVPSIGLSTADFELWFDSISNGEAEALEAILFGQAREGESLPDKIRKKSPAAIIAVVDNQSLDQTLKAFGAGVDDVVKKPVHARELLARIDAILRRRATEKSAVNRCKVFVSGGDPIIGGAPLPLPRREQRILEYLVRYEGRRVSKTQLFNAVYGMFNGSADESIVESHVSKLRKKLRERIAYDPIDTKRFLGYCLKFRHAIEGSTVTGV
jgi:two-component system, OmpR family, flagellar system response regulator FtcR